MLAEQVDAILHHPLFQRLEASWRGLDLLTRQAGGAENVVIRVLDASWRELVRDMERAIEFDQSALFRKAYSDEFGSPGGRPFSVLLGDYYVAHRPRADQPVDDLQALQSISQVAAAAFAPFICSAHPALFGLDSFTALGRPIDLARVFGSAEYGRWNRFRDQEDSRFIGLTLPRVLLRRPWTYDVQRADHMRYVEDVGGGGADRYLWGNACFALGSVLIRAFRACGWLADIRGVVPGEESGGLVVDLPGLGFDLEREGAVYRPPTEFVVTDSRERELADLGFLSLCACPGTPFAAFYATPSVQRPERHTTEDASANARLSAMLQYVFCASRFAHYLKVICRDRTGTYARAEEIEAELTSWLNRFSVSSENAKEEIQARFPLREGSVQVREIPGRPGTFATIIHLRPHFQLDQMTSSIRLVTEVVNTG